MRKIDSRIQLVRFYCCELLEWSRLFRQHRPRADSCRGERLCNDLVQLDPDIDILVPRNRGHPSHLGSPANRMRKSLSMQPRRFFIVTTRTTSRAGGFALIAVCLAIANLLAPAPRAASL